MSESLTASFGGRAANQSSPPGVPRVGLALQGGGNHGAFTWGVLRALLPYLEQKGYPLCGLIGDSAGAMNAVYAGYGWTEGRNGSKAQGADFMLERLWWTVDREARFARQAMAARNMCIPFLTMAEMTRQLSSNVQEMLNIDETARLNRAHPALPFNKDGRHHLEHIVGRQIDFNRLNQPDAPVIIVNTTNVRDGGLDAYRGERLSSKAVAGSGTLPELFNHMQIGNGLHWDGGFIANPPIQPLYNACPQMTDLIVVRVTPLHMRTTNLPEDDGAKYSRRMEMLLNAAVEAELRWAQQHAQDTGRQFNIHMISVPEQWSHDRQSMIDIQNTNWNYFMELREAGEQAARQALAQDGKAYGQAHTYDIPYRVHGEAPGVVQNRPNRLVCG